eukprot:NODE_27007_length_529_cov_2.728856.p2 GENE.NODE_27007_length_529_cov_2.728856~~NODE_27007_length_529_cov_2.728856.p2  ORF type:complete len:71 (+),score=0.68 NODE_27007_length_529_cov_2.728856:205-417(+)
MSRELPSTGNLNAFAGWPNGDIANIANATRPKLDSAGPGHSRGAVHVRGAATNRLDSFLQRDTSLKFFIG